MWTTVSVTQASCMLLISREHSLIPVIHIPLIIQDPTESHFLCEACFSFTPVPELSTKIFTLLCILNSFLRMSSLFPEHCAITSI